MLCSVTLSIADDQGNVIKSNTVPQFIAGRSVSIDVNADTDLPGSQRTEIHGFSISPACTLPTSLELIDNTTQKTVLVVGSQKTYPRSRRPPLPRRSPRR